MLNELLERYWNAAYAEGKEGRDHDTQDGFAQRTLTEIHAEVQRMVEAEREACAALAEETAAGRDAEAIAEAIRQRSNVERNRDARHHRAAPVDGSVGGAVPPAPTIGD